MKVPGFWSEDGRDRGLTRDRTDIGEPVCLKAGIKWVAFGNGDPALLGQAHLKLKAQIKSFVSVWSYDRDRVMGECADLG